MKKTLSLLFAVVLVFSLVLGAASTAEAAGEPTFRVSSAVGEVGQTVSVTISLENNPGISSIRMLVSYDPALILRNIGYNNAMGGQSYPPETMSSPATLIWLSPFANYSGDGVFATLTFEVTSAAANLNQAGITLTYDPEDVYNMAENNIAFNVINGTVTIPGNAPTPFAITAQPQDYVGPVGDTAVFGVTATGDGLTYRWQFRDVDGTWRNSTSTASTVSCPIRTDRNGREYRCIVTDVFGNTQTSEAAKIIVGTPLAVTGQPQDYVGSVGGTAVFGVTAAGDGLTYRWQFRDVNGEWRNSASTASTVSCEIRTDRNGREYRCIVKDAYGNTLTSEAAKIMVGTPLAVTAQPQDYIGPVGGTAVIGVTATGDGLTYRWQFRDVNGAWRNSTSTESTVTCPIRTDRNGREYRCVVTDAYGNTLTSEAAKIVVGTPLAVTAQPQDYYGPVGDTAVFGVTATGDGLTYRWQFRDVNGAWRNSASTASTVSCEIRADRSGREYRCVVTDAYGNTRTSEAAEIVVE